MYVVMLSTAYILTVNINIFNILKATNDEGDLMHVVFKYALRCICDRNEIESFLDNDLQ